MSPRPITKGGVITGSVASRRSDRLKRNEVRVTTSANARPSAVHAVAVSVASSSVFQATPQRAAPPRQPSPHTFGAPKRSANAAGENEPALSSKAESSTFVTGKKVKSATRPVTATTLPVTKRSPLKRPCAARPSASNAAKVQVRSVAPSPIPGCPPGPVVIAKP